MNVMVYNKYKDLLLSLKLDVVKSLEGVFNVDEIIDTFANFYYEKMILDITSIRDYQNFDNLQKLAMNINMENVILLLDDNEQSNTKGYLSKLVSLGIYNFTRNADGINYLLVHPHTYRDVVSVHNIEDIDIPPAPTVAPVAVPAQNNVDSVAPATQEHVVNNVVNAQMKIIGFKNATTHAGATTLVYMLKKALSGTKKVAAMEVNRVDFLYFDDKELISTTTTELPKELMKKNSYDYVFVDLNDYDDISICNEVYYLIEPSTIMINKMLRRNKNILETLKKEKVILNKCVLNSEDIAAFEYETKLKVVAAIAPVDDRQNTIEEINKFINKINL